MQKRKITVRNGKKVTLVNKTIATRWHMGQAVKRPFKLKLANLLAKDGQEPRKLFKSNEDAQMHRRLFQRWTITQALYADEIGLPWRCVVPLLAYAPTLKEVKKAVNDSELRAAIHARRKQVDWFLDSFGDGILKGEFFNECVRLWRKEHHQLWSLGRRSRMQFDQHRKIEGAVEELRSDNANYIDWLSNVKGSEVGLSDTLIDGELQLHKRLNIALTAFQSKYGQCNQPSLPSAQQQPVSTIQDSSTADQPHTIQTPLECSVAVTQSTTTNQGTMSMNN